MWDGDEVLVFGRKAVASGTWPYCRDYAMAYDPATDVWRTLPPAPGPVGCFEGQDQAVWTGTEVLLWGVTNTAYNPATDRWRHLPDPPAGAGGPSVTVWTGKQMIGWGGGCCASAVADGAVYTPASDSWKLLPKSPLSARHTTGVWTGTEMILAGGTGPDTGEILIYADAAAYNPSTHTWRRLAPMPVPRSSGTAFWDGKEMLLFGGTTQTGRWTTEPMARGFAYDPATNRWRWLAPMAYPRTGNVTAWTGTQVMVWGGTMEGGTVPPHGEAFDPRTDTWSALPRAPLRGRVEATAEWTGHELLIWGGYDARDWEKPMAKLTPLPDGAAFTPAST